MFEASLSIGGTECFHHKVYNVPPSQFQGWGGGQLEAGTNLISDKQVWLPRDT